MIAVADRRGKDAPRFPEGQDVAKKTQALTPRELELLAGIRAGKTYPSIAHDLKVSFETVKSYVARLRAKLGIDTKVGLALWAERNLKD